MRELKFECPSCGETQLEEVQPMAIVTSRITRITCDGDIDYADNPTILADDDSPGIFFQCFSCGRILKDEEGEIADCCRLAEWLKKQPYNITTIKVINNSN